MHRSTRRIDAVIARIVLALCAVTWAGSLAVVEGRSTTVLRFSHEVIASPARQQISLYFQYFVGDGEAIVRSYLKYPEAVLQINDAGSELGNARISPTQVEIDYSKAPLTGVKVDTLHMNVSAFGTVSSVPLVVEIESSAVDGVAHRHEASLRVEPGPQSVWSITPQQLFRGESARLTLRVGHEGYLERPLREVQWVLPEGIQPRRAEDLAWNGVVTVGDTLVETIEVKVDEGLVGEQHIGVLVAVGELPPIPLEKLSLRIDPLPVVEVLADVIDVGQEQTVAFRWYNYSARSMLVSALRLEVNSAFSDVDLVDEEAGARLEMQDGLRYVTIDELRKLEPNEYVQVDLRVRPQRPGPFIWRAFARPQEREDFIPLTGDLLVMVAWPEGEKTARNRAIPTDLELVSASFLHALDEQMGLLPINRDVPIYLEYDVKNDANWIVEDVLGEVVRERGHRLLVQEPKKGAEAVVIRYRLVSSRVVYSSGGSLPLLRRSKVREAYGDLVLRLVDQRDRVVHWERRIRSYKKDLVPGASADILGGEAVKRATIEADNKIMERGLSASIIGGLVYIFFIL